MKPMKQERRKMKPIAVRGWAWEGRPWSAFERLLEMREQGFRESLGQELRETELGFRVRERARWDLLWELEGSTMEVWWRLGLGKLQRLEWDLGIGEGLVRGGARRWGGIDDWGKRAWRVSHGVSFEVAQMKPNHSSKPTLIPTSNPLWILATVAKHLNKQSNPLWIPPLCSYRSSWAIKTLAFLFLLCLFFPKKVFF